MADDTISIENRFKVSLRQKNTQPYTRGRGGRSDRKLRDDIVVFDVSPDLTETRNVEYRTMSPIHMPGQIHSYGSTSSRTFSISNVKLISRTIEEATDNMNSLWILRSWTMPYFGERSSTLSENENERRKAFRQLPPDEQKRIRGETVDYRKRQYGSELLGKPPEVLLLNAYSDLMDSEIYDDRLRTVQTNIDNVPVVIQSLAIPYTADVDYIPTQNGQPFPRVMILDIQLLETRAPREFSQKFSLSDYKRGTLRGF